MQMDRYTKIVLTVATLALCFIAIGPLFRPIPVKADSTQDMSGVVRELTLLRGSLDKTKKEMEKLNRDGVKVRTGTYSGFEVEVKD